MTPIGEGAVCGVGTVSVAADVAGAAARLAQAATTAAALPRPIVTRKERRAMRRA